MYNYTGTDLPPINNGGGGGGVPVLPKTIGLPAGWTFNACWVYVLSSSGNISLKREMNQGQRARTYLPDGASG